MHFLGLFKKIDFDNVEFILVNEVLIGSFLFNLTNRKTPLKEKSDNYKGSQCDLNCYNAFFFPNISLFVFTAVLQLWKSNHKDEIIWDTLEKLRDSELENKYESTFYACI